MSIQNVNLFAISDQGKLKDISLAAKSDSAIFKESVKYGCERVHHLPSSKMLEGLSGATIGTIALMYACKQSGKLSNKIAAGTSVLGLFAFMGVLSSSIKKHFNFNVATKKEDKNHNIQYKPSILGPIMQLGMLAGTTLAGLIGARYAMGAISKSFPKFTQNIKGTFTKLADDIDNSSLGAKTEELKGKYQEFAKNNIKEAKFLEKNSIPLVLLGFIATALTLGSKVKSDRNALIVRKANRLTNERQEAREKLMLNA